MQIYGTIFFFRLSFNILHKISLGLIKEYLTDNKKVLDIGCATGNFLFKMQKINKKSRIIRHRL